MRSINSHLPAIVADEELLYEWRGSVEDMRHRLGITIYSLDAWHFSHETAETTLKGHFHVNSLAGLAYDYAYGK